MEDVLVTCYCQARCLCLASFFCAYRPYDIGSGCTAFLFNLSCVTCTSPLKHPKTGNLPVCLFVFPSVYLSADFLSFMPLIMSSRLSTWSSITQTGMMQCSVIKSTWRLVMGYPSRTKLHGKEETIHVLIIGFMDRKYTFGFLELFDILKSYMYTGVDVHTNLHVTWDSNCL